MLFAPLNSRIFIMNGSKLKNDDELEEGEIDDDELLVRVETKTSKRGPKSKKLPKRYMLSHPNKEWSVRKKKCNRKHSHNHSSHHAPVKRIASRKGHSQCRHNASAKRLIERINKSAHKKLIVALHEEKSQGKLNEKSAVPKRCQNMHVVDKHHFPAAKVGVSKRASHSFSDRASKLTPKRRFSMAGCTSEVFKSKSPAVVDKNASYEVLLAQYKVLQNELDNIKHPERKSPKAAIVAKLEEEKNLITSAAKGVNGFNSEGVCQKVMGRKYSQISESSSQTSTASVEELSNYVEEEEDLQALRQKALASCMDNIARKTKNKGLRKLSALSVKSTDSNEPQNVELTSNRIGLKGTDNYDLVDMEIDSEDDLSVVLDEACDKSNLITHDVAGISVETFQDEEELDEVVLRAKLIQSLAKKKAQNENCINLSPVHSPENDATLVAEEDVESEISAIPVLDSRTSQCIVTCDSPAEKNGPLVPAINLNPSLKLCTENNQPDVQRHVLKNIPYYNQQKPIVISLKEDSSSEGSDAESPCGRSANAIASLELLVKDARNESDSVRSRNIIAPGAVACLSKAQQQEYNKLKEIIAKKECSKLDPKIMITALNDLQVLERKLRMQKAVLEKRNQVLNELRVQAAKEKLYNEKILLTITELKKQLRVAEGKKKKAESSIRALHSRIRTIKSENERHQALISDLEINCRKLGLHTKGPNYCLPVPSSTLLIKKAV